MLRRKRSTCERKKKTCDKKKNTCERKKKTFDKKKKTFDKKKKTCDKKKKTSEEDLRKSKVNRPTNEEINNGIAWMETALDASELGYKENLKLFTVDRSIMNWKPGTAGNVVLYCRDGFNEQMHFLEEKVCKEGYMGWILCPPRTGKTTTTICFILSKSMEEGWV